MKEFNFIKAIPQGTIKGIFRVHERFIYLKYNDHSESRKMVKAFKEKGLYIEEGKGWIKIDLFKNYPLIKLGNEEINLDESFENIDNKLYNFYKEQYKKQGFIVQETQNEPT